MVEKEPSRDTAYGAFCAFDDKSEGSLSVGEVNVCLFLLLLLLRSPPI